MSNTSKHHSRLPRRSLLLLTSFFVAAYFVMRSLPVEPCDFLHQQDTIGETEGLEYCGPGESNFINLDDVRFPFRSEVLPKEKPVSGQLSKFELRLFNYKGEALSGEDVAVSHTQKIHLLCVDESLSDYQHVHPVEVAPGLFEFSINPSFGGTYKLFLDFIMMRSGGRVLLHNSFSVEGVPRTPSWDGVLQAQSGDFSLALKVPSGEEVLAGREQTIQLNVHNTLSGNPAKLEPVMGAFAHLVAFDESRTGFAHFHPLNQSNLSKDSSLSGLQFSFKLTDPGNYRLWAQVMLEGRERFVPFDLKVI